MRTLVLSAGFALSVFLSFAASDAQATPLIEVTCYNEDCFRNGWIAEYPIARFWAQTICNEGDCANKGWRVSDSRGVDTDVACVGRGCFVDGWIESVARGRQSQYFKCKAPPATPNQPNPTPDCWTYGFEANGPSVWSSVSCLNGSCRTGGWVTKVSGQRDVTTVCKSGPDQATGQMISSCFRFGWNVYK